MAVIRINPVHHPYVKNVVATHIDVREPMNAGKRVLVFWLTMGGASYGPFWIEVPDWCQEFDLILDQGEQFLESRIGLKPTNGGDADAIWCRDDGLERPDPTQSRVFD